MDPLFAELGLLESSPAGGYASEEEAESALLNSPWYARDDDDNPVSYTNPRTTCDPLKYRPEWAAWIAEHFPTAESASCRCCSAARELAAAFPGQLREAAGYFGLYGIEHAWCVDLLTGNVVDPTGIQFTARLRYSIQDWTKPGAYQELTRDEIERYVPSGVCMDCGADVYHGKTFCSDECERATMAYLNSSAARF